MLQHFFSSRISRLFSQFIKLFLAANIILLLGFFITTPESKALTLASQKWLVSNTTFVALQAPEETVKAVEIFSQAVRGIDPEGNVFLDVSPAEHKGMVSITVSNGWHYQPYQIRKQATQGLWRAWAMTYSPENPDNARIKILDLNGNRVGGSSLFAGSLVDVDK